jgi:RimJ/RimL family protein N-acetyltransferase
MASLIPFRKEHLEIMELGDREAALLSVEGSGEALENSSVAVTGIIDGRVICCGGVVVNRYGAGEVWLLPSKRLKDHKFEACKAIKQWLDGVALEAGLHRLQTHCVDDDFHAAWMTFLGFEKEGVLRQYIKGTDYAIWGKLWE